jgi:hypothetical protein
MGRIDLGRAVGTAPGGTSTTTTVPGSTTTVPSTTSTAPSTTTPGETTSSAPPVSIPEVAAPAPFSPDADANPADEPPSWLVTLAILAILAVGSANAVVLWQRWAAAGSSG